MIDTAWLSAAPSSLLMVFLTALGTYAAMVLFTRMAGLRSFSKLSSFDFAVTVAFGSVLASTILSETPSLAQGVTGLAVLFLIQWGVSVLRRHSALVSRMVDNEPLLIMVGSQVLEENLAQGQMTLADLRAKLREANVLDLTQIRAVVMETTGDVSVLHGDPGGPALDPAVMEGVRGWMT